AVEHSTRPIAVTHANPAAWHPARRNKSDAVIGALAKTGGMLGFSLYPHHLKGGSACEMTDFCTMIARTAERHGTHFLGIGTDLCQDQPDSVVEWMRTGRWTKSVDFGEGSKDAPGFPAMPGWFRDNRDFGTLRGGLHAVGFSADEVAAILGGNWARFFATSFGPAAGDEMARAAQ
ncbi:MAG: dipeptidase, partial [Paracoccaceae bacterium]|nr:dipeptidase [Paracoccaceae bacterium]